MVFNPEVVPRYAADWPGHLFESVMLMPLPSSKGKALCHLLVEVGVGDGVDVGVGVGVGEGVAVGVGVGVGDMPDWRSSRVEADDG
jgi:hypothetical protein